MCTLISAHQLTLLVVDSDWRGFMIIVSLFSFSLELPSSLADLDPSPDSSTTAAVDVR